MLEQESLLSLLFLNFHDQSKAGQIKTFNLSLLMTILCFWAQLFGFWQLIRPDFGDLDHKVPPPKASRWQDQPRAWLPWAPWAFPKCKTGRSCSHSHSTASDRGEITPLGSRIRSHLHPKHLRPTRAKPWTSRHPDVHHICFFPEGTDPVTHPTDTQIPPQELPMEKLLFFTANKIPGRQIPSNNPQLDQTNTNPGHPWSSKADPWSNN